MAAQKKFEVELDYREAYDSLIRSIRACLGIRRKRAEDARRFGTRYRVGPKWIRRVALKLAAAQAIAELSGCWHPDEIIDQAELDKLIAEFHSLIEGSSQP